MAITFMWFWKINFFKNFFKNWFYHYWSLFKSTFVWNICSYLLYFSSHYNVKVKMGVYTHIHTRTRACVIYFFSNWKALQKSVSFIFWRKWLFLRADLKLSNIPRLLV